MKWRLACAVSVWIFTGSCGGEDGARDPEPATRSSATGASEDVPARPGATPEPGRALFVDASATWGVDFAHEHGGVGNRELPETMGGGVGFLDFDADGDLDLYFAQSGAVRTPEQSGGGPNALCANDGAAHFSRVPDAAGAAGHGYSMGCAIGDANGDGLDDVLDLCWGPSTLFVNGGGSFVDGTAAAGLGAEELWSVSAAFFDAEGDGDLDLYVVNYLDSPPGSYVEPRFNPAAPGPYKAYPHPDRFRSQGDRFYLNQGDGTFVDRTREAGFEVVPGKGLGVVPTDVDLDGGIDLYVANDSTPNFLFVNRGGAKFEELGSRAGTAFNDHGRTEAGMGVDAADADGDGDLDLFVTNLDLETNTLYVNQPRAGSRALTFRDRTNAAGLGEPSRLRVGFGALFLDVDLDGDQDLLVANGHIIDNVEAIADNRQYAQANQLYLNDGAGSFIEAPASAAPGLERRTVSRGSAYGDLDGDGRLDVVIGANGHAPQVFLGRPPAAEALVLRLSGPAGNPHGLGSKVFLELANGTTLLRGIESTRSYASSSEPVLVTGLPAPLRAIEVLWPGGTRERFGAVKSPARLVFGTGSAPTE